MVQVKTLAANLDKASILFVYIKINDSEFI